MDLLERFQRIIVVEFTGADLGELGLGRGNEASSAGDSFALLIKAPNRDDAYNLMERARSIVIEIPGTCEYTRIEIGSPTFTNRRGRWYINLTATCYRSGRVRHG